MRKVTKVTCLFFGLCHGCVHPIWNPFCTRCRPAHPCTSRVPKASSHRKSAAREVWWACPLTKLLKSSRWTPQRWWRSWNERRGPPPRTELTWETRWGFRLRWGWDITTKTCFVRDRSATLTSALHSCNNFDMFQRCFGKVWNFNWTAERTWSAIELERVHRASVCWSLSYIWLKFVTPSFQG